MPGETGVEKGPDGDISANILGQLPTAGLYSQVRSGTGHRQFGSWHSETVRVVGTVMDHKIHARPAEHEAAAAAAAAVILGTRPDRQHWQSK